MDKKLFVAWQDSARKWHTIGRLTQGAEGYELVFTKGAIPFADVINKLFKLELGYRYRFKDLIPLFRNKILSSNRPDFVRLSDWVGVKSTETEFDRLAKFGPIPGTDSMLVYPEALFEHGKYSVDFYVHGIRHMHDDAQSWTKEAGVKTKLLPMLDLQNEADQNAVALRASHSNILVGYVPAFYASEINKILRREEINEHAEFSILRMNKDAPAQIRLFCRFEATVDQNYKLSLDEDALPLTQRTNNMQTSINRSINVSRSVALKKAI
jgi:hypothetical protein